MGMSILGKKTLLKLVLLLVLIPLLLCSCAAKQIGPTEEERFATNADGQTAQQAAAHGVSVSEAGQAIAITESRHYREENYAADFKTYRLALDHCTVEMESRIYDEAALRAAGEQIQLDLAAMAEATGTPAQNVEVYLVNQTLTGRAQVVGSRVFCTPEDMEDLSYRQVLTQASYGLSRPWQGVGLSRYVFEAAPDTAELRAYYEDAAHTNVLSLFPMYFLPDFTDAETVQMAEQTAQSVTAYVLETDGIAAFCALDTTMDAVMPWALANQIEAPALPEGYEAVDGLAVASVSDHAVILQADGQMDHFRFVLEPKDWISTAEDFYTYLCRFYAGYHVLLEQMEEALPTAFTQVRQNAEQQITVNLLNTDAGKSHSGKWEVFISGHGAIWHEVLHNILPHHGADRDDHWLSESIPGYFELPIVTQFGGYESAWNFRYLTDAEMKEEMPEDDKEFQNCTLRCYTSRFALPENEDDIYYDWLYRSFAITTLLRSELQPGNYYTPVMNTQSVHALVGLEAGEKEIDGNGLTYPEALLMTDYLAESYGIDHVVSSFLAHESCEEAYGKAYSELYEEFFAWVQERYGDLIADVHS